MSDDEYYEEEYDDTEEDEVDGIDEDELSPEEAAFLKGYDDAYDIDSEEDEIDKEFE